MHPKGLANFSIFSPLKEENWGKENDVSTSFSFSGLGGKVACYKSIRIEQEVSCTLNSGEVDAWI